MVTEIVKNGNKTESLESLSLKLSEAARVGLVLLEATKTNSKIADSEKEVFTKILANSKVPEGGAELAVVEAIQKLMPK
jgi:hypothetical protein